MAGNDAAVTPQDYFDRPINVMVDQGAMNDEQKSRWNANISQVPKANFENNHLSLDGPPECYDEPVSLQLAGCKVRDL